MRRYIKPRIRVERIDTECLLAGTPLRIRGNHSNKDAMGKEYNIFGNDDAQGNTPPIHTILGKTEK